MSGIIWVAVGWVAGTIVATKIQPVNTELKNMKEMWHLKQNQIRRNAAAERYKIRSDILGKETSELRKRVLAKFPATEANLPKPHLEEPPQGIFLLVAETYNDPTKDFTMLNRHGINDQEIKNKLTTLYKTNPSRADAIESIKDDLDCEKGKSSWNEILRIQEYILNLLSK